MVVHGIPGPYELRRGDILSIDVGVTYEGWVADAAITVPIGESPPEAEPLLTTTRDALFEGIAQAVQGNHLSDISHAVQQRVERDGLSIIRTLVGHGIGRDMHEDPQIPNFGDPGKGPELEIGMALAIEPMVNAGGPEVRMGSDGWAVYSQDDSLAAHFEFTVAITADGPSSSPPGTSSSDREAAQPDAPTSSPGARPVFPDPGAGWPGPRGSRGPTIPRSPRTRERRSSPSGSLRRR